MRMLTFWGLAAPPRRGRRPKVSGPDMQHGKILDISAAETAPLEPDHKMIHKPLINHQPSTFRTLHGSTLLRPLTLPCEHPLSTVRPAIYKKSKVDAKL